MPDVRECAACGKMINWFPNSGGGIVALDTLPNVDKGMYFVVCDMAVWKDSLGDPMLALLAGPLYQSHVATCKKTSR